MRNYQFNGFNQYQTLAEGQACDAWLTQWASDHAAQLRSGWPNSHTLTTTLNPDTEEGCVCQLDYAYNIKDDDDAAFQATWAEIVAAIGEGGTEGSASCGSSGSSGAGGDEGLVTRASRK